MTTRTLSVGDVIAANPCVVTIHTVGVHNGRGFCSHCEVDHIISVPRYESGEGPWQPAQTT